MIVVAGADDSAHAPTVIRKAIDEAVRRQAELHVVHVFHPPVAYLEVPLDVSAISEAERSAVWGALSEVLAEAPVPVKSVDLEGYPPDTLVDYANEVGAGLLVVGTRGRGELASLILGSTSHRALHLAGCDVLVVKPQES